MGIGIEVGAPVGVLGGTVSVGMGVSVEVKVAMCERVSEARTPVAVLSTTADGAAVGLGLLRVQAKIVAMKRVSKQKFLIFIASLY